MAEIFQDIFSIHAANKDGKPFDRVSRIFCNGESFKMELILDVNDQIYPVKGGDKFRFTLLRNLRNDHHMDTEEGNFNVDSDSETEDVEESNLIDCDYCMYGKIYKIIPTNEDGDEIYSTYVSFGGLLMMLKGASINFNGVKVGQNIYMKMKRIAY